MNIRSNCFPLSDAQDGVPFECQALHLRLPPAPGREERKGEGEGDHCRSLHHNQGSQEGVGEEGARREDGSGE